MLKTFVKGFEGLLPSPYDFSQYEQVDKEKLI
jgi:uncharacterized membrane protein